MPRTDPFRDADPRAQYARTHFFLRAPAGSGQARATVLEVGDTGVSRPFEEALGWNAVVIEAGAERFRRIGVQRPRTLALNLAVCDARTTLHYVALQKPEGGGGVAEFMTPTFLMNHAPKYLTRDYHKDWPRIHEEAQLVRCVPMHFVADMLGLTRVDLLVLDVQGAELSVLNTFPFRNVTVGVWCLANGSEDQEVLIDRLLSEHGYRFYAHNRNTLWFINPDLTVQT